jgi:hypothetical protein
MKERTNAREDEAKRAQQPGKISGPGRRIDTVAGHLSGEAVSIADRAVGAEYSKLLAMRFGRHRIFVAQKIEGNPALHFSAVCRRILTKCRNAATNCGSGDRQLSVKRARRNMSLGAKRNNRKKNKSLTQSNELTVGFNIYLNCCHYFNSKCPACDSMQQLRDKITAQ